MISAMIYFKNDINVEKLVNDLLALPKSIRPIYFTEDEGRIIKANKLTDDERFKEFRKRNQVGFFLYAENKTCFDISSGSTGYSEVSLDLAEGLPGDLIPIFLKSLARHMPVFGFGCDYEEYEHRNYHDITIGVNQISGFVGRNLEKYIPSVYWNTLLSDEMLSKHDVDLINLSSEAITMETVGNGSLHLLRFYENPEDWKENAERLDHLCERVDGIFSRKSVETAVVGVSNWLEYMDVTREWD